MTNVSKYGFGIMNSDHCNPPTIIKKANEGILIRPDFNLLLEGWQNVVLYRFAFLDERLSFGNEGLAFHLLSTSYILNKCRVVNISNCITVDYLAKAWSYLFLYNPPIFRGVFHN